mgnify:CR=1 FL=1
MLKQTGPNEPVCCMLSAFDEASLILLRFLQLPLLFLS